MRLNLGMGDHRAPAPWLNLDVRAEARPDIRADAAHLPVRDGSVSALYAGHLLEHVPLGSVATVLAEWRRVLRPDGRLMIVGPDIERAVHQREPWWILDSILVHDQPPAGHAWTCSEPVVRWLLEANGWQTTSRRIAEVLPPEWPNPAPHGAWQLAVEATPC